MSFSKSISFISGLILSIGLATSTAIWAAGTPSGFTISPDGKSLNVIAFNFSNEYTIEEVNEWHSVAVLAYNILGVEGNVKLYPPALINSMGYDGDSLHTWLVSILPEFQSYTQIKVSKYVAKSGTYHIFDIWTWSPGDLTGFYIGDVVAPDLDKLPLSAVFDVMSPGSRYINIITDEAYHNGIDDVLHLEFYYMENNAAPRVFVAGIEISATAIQSIFNAVLSP